MSNPLGAFEWKLEVVMVRPFSLFLLHNHFITDFFFKKNPAKHNTKYKDSAIFAFYFLLHKRAKPILPPYPLPPPIPPPIPRAFRLYKTFGFNLRLFIVCAAEGGERRQTNTPKAY